MKKEKVKPSFSAILMYCIIAVSALVFTLCFIFYYGDIHHKGWLLWTGVTCFTIAYQLQTRIIMGNVSKLFRISHKQKWFCEKPFEARLYKFLRVKSWKGKALTYNPELYDVKNRTLTQIADTTAKSETDHWINVLISLSCILFSIIWGQVWIFALTAFLAILFDAQFIVIQRYNRPRLIKLINKKAPCKAAV